MERRRYRERNHRRRDYRKKNYRESGCRERDYRVSRKRRRKDRTFLVMFLSLTAIIFFSALSVRQLLVYMAEDGGTQRIGDFPAAGSDLGHLYSSCVILVDKDSGETLAERNARERIYPASLTKVMTALLAVESIGDPDETIVLSEEYVPALYEEGASMAGFLPGERVRCLDLLYGCLLPSGAECCLAFADRIAGSEEDFAEMMNHRAEELGMENTCFRNSTGLHDPDHYSTVEDISILLRHALENEVFRAAFTSSRHSVPPSDQHPGGFTFYSTLSGYMEQAGFSGGEILGGKTGYTEEAGLCLASLAQVGGKEYILVTAKADGSHETKPYHVLDAAEVYGSLAR